jgi:hypothetical protein
VYHDVPEARGWLWWLAVLCVEDEFSSKCLNFNEIESFDFLLDTSAYSRHRFILPPDTEIDGEVVRRSDRLFATRLEVAIIKLHRLPRTSKGAKLQTSTSTFVLPHFHIYLPEFMTDLS